MQQQSLSPGDTVYLSLGALDALIGALAARGFRVLGPTRADGAIVYDEIAGVADLPAGWTDRQDAGRYRLEQRDDQALFGYVVGPHSWKRFLHPPTERLWQARRTEDGFAVDTPPEPDGRMAFIGVRSCELHAIAIQDRVLIDGPHPNTAYKARRADNFVVAVNCGQAGGTCFCVSMKTGPKADAGFDIALTELLANEHGFLVEIGSQAGASALTEVPFETATADHIAAADAAVAQAAGQMGRTLTTDGLKDVLQGQPAHPHWDNVAARCLTCANCTMVCPTCFCTSVEDHSDLSGQTAERVRRWDSCFNVEFSYIHGGSVRTETKSRYRQWITHKLASWIDQFGASGCVGCGRCITWCPVGIDITAEAAAMRDSGKGGKHGRA